MESEMKLEPSMFGSRYALAPLLLLTPSGPQENRVLAIDGGRIEAIADRDTFAQTHHDWPLTALPQHAIVPGFIDAHTHLGQTFGKAAIAGEPSQIWKRIWVPLEDALDVESTYVAAVWMLLEALRGGFTTIVNFTRNTHELNEAIHGAAAKVGIRLVSSCPASSGSEPLSAVLESIERHIEQCAQQTHLYPSLSFGFFTNSLKDLRPADFTAIRRFCRDRNVLFQMHSNEHFPDVHDCIVEFGKRPIELWHELGILGPGTLLHHATLVSDREIDLLYQTGTAISYNPVASVWKGNAVAPALIYADRGIPMGLGTDATRMDAFRNLDAAEACQRITHGLAKLDFSCGAGWTWVDAATRGSAEASGLSGITGQLESGLAADFLILHMAIPEVIPSWDFEWELVRYYNRDQIDAVIVGGRPVLLHGATIGWDAEAFVRNHAAFAREAVDKAGIRRVHGPSSAYRPLRGPPRADGV
jgi:cytosine/adenosine deaminase-related metal-dependent hydrolase